MFQLVQLVLRNVDLIKVYGVWLKMVKLGASVLTNCPAVQRCTVVVVDVVQSRQPRRQCSTQLFLYSNITVVRVVVCERDRESGCCLAGRVGVGYRGGSINYLAQQPLHHTMSSCFSTTLPSSPPPQCILPFRHFALLCRSQSILFPSFQLAD